MDDALDDLVKSSANFGYLVEHEPVLALDGASAESYIYTDPDAAIFKARRFLEALSKKAVAVFNVRSEATRLYHRIRDLHEAGVIDTDIQGLCDLVRTAGNEAVHGQMRNVHVALRVVRHCFDLGLWLHNAITGGQETKVFVPPQPPELAPSVRDADGLEALREIRFLLTTFERRLVLLELERDGAAGRSAEEFAPIAAAAMVRQASLGQAVRSAEERVESRRSELAAAALDGRLVGDATVSESRQDELRRNAGAATDLLRREADRLGQIAQDVAQRLEEGDSGGALVFNVAGDKSNNFVVGKVYGSTVNPTFGEGWRR